MKVFNLYGKIFKRNFKSIVAYIIAFMVISVIFIGSGNNSSSSAEFNETLIEVTIVNNDEDTILIEGLKDYLKNYVAFVDVKEEHILDALYYREIYMALTIPKNFTDDFLNGKNVNISEQTIPDSVSNITVNRAINKFLNLVNVYKDNLQKDLTNDKNLNEVIGFVKADLSNEVKASKTIANTTTISSISTFFNYLSYLLFALIMSVIGIVMIRIRRIDIKRRMSIAPISETKVNLQIIFGHFLFTIAIVVVMSIICFLFYGSDLLTTNGLLHILNAFCVSFAILAFGYVLSLLIKNENALNASVNVISLGTSFLAGAFIPQFLLGKGMLAFAHILPNYYYVTNNNRIAYLTSFTWDKLSNIFLYMLIQILFAIGFIILAIFISKKQSKAEA